MTTVDQHSKDCLRELGKEYREVHEWLDELFKDLGSKHRDVRHHEGGVDEAIKKWGEEAGEAARIHIRRDCYGKVPTEKEAQMWSLFGRSGVPKDGRTFLTDGEL